MIRWSSADVRLPQLGRHLADRSRGSHHRRGSACGLVVNRGHNRRHDCILICLFRAIRPYIHMIQYHPFDLLFVSSPVVSGTFHSLGQGGHRGMHKDKNHGLYTRRGQVMHAIHCTGVRVRGEGAVVQTTNVDSRAPNDLSSASRCPSPGRFGVGPDLAGR